MRSNKNTAQRMEEAKYDSMNLRDWRPFSNHKVTRRILLLACFFFLVCLVFIFLFTRRCCGFFWVFFFGLQVFLALGRGIFAQNVLCILQLKNTFRLSLSINSYSEDSDFFSCLLRELVSLLFLSLFFPFRSFCFDLTERIAYKIRFLQYHYIILSLFMLFPLSLQHLLSAIVESTIY